MDNSTHRLWTAKDFIEYIKLRWKSPLFSKKCCWYGTGSIVSCETGKVIALLEGLEWGTVRSISQQSSNQGTMTAVVSSKKLYFFKDPETGKYLSEQVSLQQTRKVHPISYPQQDIQLVWNNHSVELSKESVSSKTVLGARVANMANIRVYSLPIFVRMGSKKAGYISTLEKYELYQYNHFLSRLLMSPILSWVRYGDCPSWYGKGKCTSYLVSKKLNSTHSLPKEFIHQVRKIDPSFLQQSLSSYGETFFESDNKGDHRSKRILGERSFSK
ncbi:hypothetical protein GpartN1_g136.t1 [Galdieria partita]|uniref:Uncharacterized protein n=1 Tax=Galdieria partita TaxID=83374 RepID=A0A9C7PQ14_9RHOD|nr:hypothetical protein GpartN1_g136.t1 [Galdieria partita]